MRMNKVALVLMAAFGMASCPGTVIAQINVNGAYICASGVIVYGNNCPAVIKNCGDGTYLPDGMDGSPSNPRVHEFCKERGGVVYWETPPRPAPAPAAPVPEPAPQPTGKCTDGTTISAATVAKGKAAMTSFCANRGGIKGTVGGNR
jgi:hypothetical protein